jgi:nitrite reductase/ring-hydroxylating ferredoxin subunit
MADSEYVQVAALANLREGGPAVVSPADHAIALFHHEGEVCAVDNRCPHMGFPLSKGTVEDGLLTCHWHHARFELAEGDTLDIFADDVQTFPVEIRDGEVYVDPDPEPEVPPETRWRNRLVDGVAETLSLVQAKAVIHLDDFGEGFSTPVETAVDFGTTYRADGWGRGLTTLAAMANLYDRLTHPEKLRAMHVGVGAVADNCAGEPPRFDQYALGNRELTKDRLKSWFRENCEVRDSDGAERTIRAAAALLDPGDVAEIMVAAGTDHLYLNASHTLDFLNKAFETLDHVGWEHAEDVLASTVEGFTDAARAEERPEWRQPVDVAALCFEVHDELDGLIAAGAGRQWDRPEGFVETLLSDDPKAIVDALRDAIREGTTSEGLAHAVALAATRRVAHFDTSNEFRDWNTVHHTFTYANAVHGLARRTDADEVYRGCVDAAMSVYLDRFLNEPPVPIPDPDDSDRDPERIREDLLAAFDETGSVDRAGELVAEHFAAGGDPDALVRTLGRGLLREDADFHTLQNFEAAVSRFDHARTDGERRLALIATARYLSAHFPTRREREQTFDIARRLHRGETLHDEE